MEKIAKNLQLILMVIILISTVIAVGIEINKMFLIKSVTLAELSSALWKCLKVVYTANIKPMWAIKSPAQPNAKVV